MKLHTVAFQLPETAIPQPGHTPSHPWGHGSEQRVVTWADQQDFTWTYKNEGSGVLQICLLTPTPLPPCHRADGETKPVLKSPGDFLGAGWTEGRGGGFWPLPLMVSGDKGSRSESEREAD